MSADTLLFCVVVEKEINGHCSYYPKELQDFISGPDS